MLSKTNIGINEILEEKDKLEEDKKDKEDEI